MRIIVHLLALALLCWIAGACLTIGYIANVAKSTGDALDRLNNSVAATEENITSIFQSNGARLKRLEKLELAAKATQKTVSDLAAQAVIDRGAFEHHRASLDAHKRLRGR
jgi:hypothetical protein